MTEPKMVGVDHPALCACGHYRYIHRVTGCPAWIKPLRWWRFQFSRKCRCRQYARSVGSAVPPGGCRE